MSERGGDVLVPWIRSSVIAVLQRLAMTRGELPVRTWEQSSSKVTSRTQCSRFSTSQWPCTQVTRTSGGAVRASALVTR